MGLLKRGYAPKMLQGRCQLSLLSNRAEYCLPGLFLYINGLPVNLENSKLDIFVGSNLCGNTVLTDDLTLVTFTTSHLQQMLNIIETYRCS